MAGNHASLTPSPVVYEDESGSVVGRGHTFDLVFRGAVVAFGPTSPLYEVLTWEKRHDGTVLGIVRKTERY